MARQLEWVKQNVSSAPGTSSTIALGTAVSGFITIGDSPVIVDQSLVLYTATDGPNVERGIARYNSAGPSLTNRTPHASLIAGVYSEDSTVTTVNLGASTVISCESVASKWHEDFSEVLPVMWNPRANSTTADSFGMLPTITGTLAARTIDNAGTGGITSFRRVGLETTASSGDIAYWQDLETISRMTDTSGYGGFKKTYIFGRGDSAVAPNVRQFVGLRNVSTAPTNVNPSTLTNCVGVAAIDGSDNLHIVYGGTSAQTPIDLGGIFDCKTDESAYRVTLESRRRSADFNVFVTVDRIVNNGTIDTTFSAKLVDTSGTFAQLPGGQDLYDHMWKTNNSHSLVVALDLGPYFSQNLY